MNELLNKYSVKKQGIIKGAISNFKSNVTDAVGLQASLLGVIDSEDIIKVLQLVSMTEEELAIEGGKDYLLEPKKKEVAERERKLAEFFTEKGDNARGEQILKPKFIKEVHTYNEQDEIVKTTRRLNKNMFTKYLVVKYPMCDVFKMKYFYEDGVYIEKAYNEIKIIIQEELDLLGDDLVGTNTIKDIAELWTNTRSVSAMAKDLNKNPYLVNFKNGILDLKTMKLLPHTMELKTTIQINANFDKNAKSKYFNDFYNFTFPDKGVQKLVWQILGYSMSLFFTQKKRFFIFFGDKDVGKSTFFNTTINALLPESARLHRELKEFTQDKYATADLFGKVVNINSELSSETVSNIELLKQLAGKDGITAQRKFGQPFSFVPIAKYIFAANTLPTISTQDASSAFYERVILVPFTKKVKFKDRSLEDNIKNNDLDYVATMAFTALHEMINNNFEFDIPENINEILQEYEEENNSVISFVQKCCILEEKGYVHKDEFMKFYNAYCEQELEQTSKSLKQVKRILEMQFDINTEHRVRNIRGYLKGITLNTQEIQHFSFFENVNRTK